MTKSQPILIVVASLIAAVCLAPCALAAGSGPGGRGEAKNVAPFDAPYQHPATTQSAVPQGEAKNEAPFTSSYTGDPGLAMAYAKVDELQAAVNGESKHTPPFTDSAGPSGSGFGWIDASIAALAVVGALLVLVAIALRRRSTLGLRGVRIEHA